MSGFKTKDKATAAALALQKRMTSKGWQIDVWENIGWHYSLYNGPIALHPGFNDRYFTLMSEQLPAPGQRPSGSIHWSQRPFFRDPNKAVRDQVKAARAYLDSRLAEITAVVEAAEAIVNSKKQRSKK